MLPFNWLCYSPEGEHLTASGGMAQTYEPVDGIRVWIDGGIHIKTCDAHGDPVEMSEEEALALAGLLQRLAAEQRG
jgi:hypothetical protein